MAWNIEIVCIADPTLDPRDVVPDVFEPTGEALIFEDATSSSRYEDLAVSRIGDWVILIDSGCRLTGNTALLSVLSEGRELHAFRIAGTPQHLHYVDGGEELACADLNDCNAALRKPDPDPDGETVAMSLVYEQTGLDWDTDLMDATFEAYSLPSQVRA